LIPVILGGDLTVFAGNLIGQQFLTARDWPFGAAIAMVVIGAMTAAIILFTRVAARAEQYGG
jgi:spermidine/putrescine transport system permease protein